MLYIFLSSNAYNGNATYTVKFFKKQQILDTELIIL